MTDLRAVMHVHSDWSYDGRWRLAEIARLYGRFGVRVVLMTEHDTGFDPQRFPDYRRACAEASSSGCRLIPGIEYSSPDNAVHILTWGLDSFLAEHRPVIETLGEVRDRGGVAVFAHPVRRDAWKRFSSGWSELLAGIEVWNRKSDGIAPGRQAADLVASAGVPATVGQDFHTRRQLYPLTMHLETRGSSETNVVDAIRTGRMKPMAFGRPLYDARRNLSRRPHDILERARAGVRDLRDALRRNRRS